MPENAIHTTNIGSPGLAVGIYVACVLGAVALVLLLPRTRKAAASLKLIGWLLGAATLGGALLALTRLAREADPGPSAYFYLFAFIAVFGAVKVVTHVRPVYAALYFILTVLASAAMFLLLAAEFMAFALIIVYAGAILITYLFVIMLAYNEVDAAAQRFRDDVDQEAREPVAAAAVGFLLLAVLTSLFVDTLHTVPRDLAERESAPALAALHDKVESALWEANLLTEGQQLLSIDAATRTATVGTAEMNSTVELPASLAIDNIESVGWDLLAEFPVSLELAGVILLLAMVGAVVLVRQTPASSEDPAAEEVAP
ncbi:MAG: NADH-quinone oxidoreductase subunit J [Phycisphaerales bacterium JB038]